MDYTKLGKIMQTARKQKGYTQLVVSSLLGVTPQNISSWELGKSKMDIDAYIKLCNLYDLDFVDSIMQCSDDPCMPHFPVTFDENGNRTDGFYASKNLTSDEWSNVKKYRALDTYGQDTVSAVLDCEHRRCNEQRPMIEAAARSGGVKQIPEVRPDELPTDNEPLP